MSLLWFLKFITLPPAAFRVLPLPEPTAAAASLESILYAKAAGFVWAATVELPAESGGPLALLGTPTRAYPEIAGGAVVFAFDPLTAVEYPLP